MQPYNNGRRRGTIVPLMDLNLDKRNIRLEITEHIFVNSPTMMALCLTMVGLIKIYTALQRTTTLVDDFLTFSIVAFLLATIFSYLALRSHAEPRKMALARVADSAFLAGLVAAAVVAIFAVFTLAG